MMHYTTHGGRLHHFPVWPGVEEQVPDEGPTYFVAYSPQAFEEGQIVAVARHKPGVVRVMLRHGDQCRTIYSKDEFLPAGTEIYG